jgi:hypothetical protein
VQGRRKYFPAGATNTVISKSFSAAVTAAISGGMGAAVKSPGTMGAEGAVLFYIIF